MSEDAIVYLEHLCGMKWKMTEVIFLMLFYSLMMMHHLWLIQWWHEFCWIIEQIRSHVTCYNSDGSLNFVLVSSFNYHDIEYLYSPCLGATSGLGLETTRVLALRSVHVVMAVRSVDSGKNVKETILKEIPSAKIDVMELDLSSMASVRKFAADFNSSGLPLNILM